MRPLKVSISLSYLADPLTTLPSPWFHAAFPCRFITNPLVCQVSSKVAASIFVFVFFLSDGSWRLGTSWCGCQHSRSTFDHDNDQISQSRNACGWEHRQKSHFNLESGNCTCCKADHHDGSVVTMRPRHIYPILLEAERHWMAQPDLYHYLKETITCHQNLHMSWTW